MANLIQQFQKILKKGLHISLGSPDSEGFVLIDTNGLAEQSDLSAEIQRAKDSEDYIISLANYLVDSEARRAKTEEKVLADTITLEFQRAWSAESTLTDLLDSESLRAVIKEAELKTLIDSESNRAIIKETSLKTEIDSEAVRITSLESTKQDIIIPTAGLQFESDSKTLRHSNSVNPQAEQKLGAISFDSQGHITGFTESVVIANLTSTSSTNSLAANQGKILAEMIASAGNIKVVETVPTSPAANTIYYVGTATPYHVYFYANDSAGSLKRYDMGTTSVNLTDYATKSYVDSESQTLRSLITQKQGSLSGTQLTAVNSGIDSTKVNQITTNTNNISTNTTAIATNTANITTNTTAISTLNTSKQDALSTEQLAATNSGITSTKVSTYDGYASTIAGKQDALPTVVKDRYLHTNATSGALEWSAVAGGGVKVDGVDTSNILTSASHAYSTSNRLATMADISGAGGGTVTSITAGTGLTGGTISSSGTIAVDTTVIQEKLTAGTGLAISGTTINHSNSVTAQASGKLGTITYDAQGHITSFTEKAVVNNLNSTATDQPLSAYQGKLLNDMVAAKGNIKVVSAKPTTPTANTIYYVGTTSPYQVWFYDSTSTWYDMGTTEISLSEYRKSADQDTIDATKQDTLTAGSNITISGTTISATDTTYTAGSHLSLTGTEFSVVSTPYTTTAPTSANTDGLKFVVLSSEPTTKYDGWIYFITG